MQKKDLESRLKALEQQVTRLTEVLEQGFRDGKFQLSSQEASPPALHFIHSREGDVPKAFGVIEAGDFGNGYHAFQVKSSGNARLDLASQTELLLQAGGTLHMNAPGMKIESSRVDLDGELSAALCRTEQFTWKSGQPPVRLVHSSHGIPVITELKGKFRNSSSGIKMYIDQEDGYWYLTGDNSKGAEVFARVICIGRV